MRLKSFHGHTLTEAMRLVREALGDDAIIVATRDDDMGGVRVTAAIDDTMLSAQPATTKQQSSQDSEKQDSDVLAEIATAIARHALSPHLAERIMATATQFAGDDSVLALGAALDAHFQFQPIIEDKPAPIVLVGPPGAGKTLTIAKLATRTAMAKRPVAVVSTDFSRAGGMEQLAAFTRLLNINLVEIEDTHALKDAIAMHKDCITFVDTAGANPFDADDRKTLQTTIAAAGGQAILTLPAGLDAAEAVELAAEFRKLGAARMLITRLDITRRLGSVLRVAAEVALPFSNYCASPKVTEAPVPMNPIALARLLLPTGTLQKDAQVQRKNVM